MSREFKGNYIILNVSFITHSIREGGDSHLELYLTILCRVRWRDDLCCIEGWGGARIGLCYGSIWIRVKVTSKVSYCRMIEEENKRTKEGFVGVDGSC